MTNRERLRAAAVATAAVAALVLSPAPGRAATAAVTALTLRHATQGWVDLIQAGAATLACPDGAPACRSDPAAPTAWVDVDDNPSTVNSSRAEVRLPPGAAVNWAGLYWGGDRGARADGALRCETAADTAAPATPPPGEANQVSVAVGDADYTAVTAAALADVTGGGGGAAYQAYADITSLLGAAAVDVGASPLALTVADVAVAQGPGCTGGWAVVVAYSFPAGPDPTYAPAYRSVAIYDGIVGLAGPQELGLDRLVPGTTDARLTSALLFAGPSVDLAVGGATLPRSGGGPGFHLGAAALAGEAVAGETATVTATPAQPTYLGAVLGLSRVLPVNVDLSVATSLTPTTLAVGDDAELKVSVRNDSDVRATGVAVTLRLPVGVSLVSGVPGYHPGTGVWSVGSVPARGSVDLTLPLRVTAPGNLTTAVEISSSHLPDADSSPGDGALGQDDLAEVAVTVAAPTPSATTEPAQAAVPPPSRTPWSRYAPAALMGAGLVALGLVLLLIVVVRGRVTSER